MKAEIERRYRHLDKKQRADFVARVLTGQRVENAEFHDFQDRRAGRPQRRRWSVSAQLMRENSFVPDRKKDVDITTTKQDDGTETKKYGFTESAAITWTSQSKTSRPTTT